MKASPTRRIEAFTLIELLVVVGIIVILASLLVTGIGRYMGSARSLACASNLRQIGTAASAFSADNDGRIVPLYSNGASANSLWPVLLSPYLGKPDATWPITIEDRVFVCPQEPHRLGYGHNYFYLGWNMPPDAPGVITPPMRIGNVSRPATILLMADSIFPANADPTAWADALRPPMHYFPNPDRTIDFRHPGSTANILWLDGHVSAEIKTNIMQEKLWNPKFEEN